MVGGTRHTLLRSKPRQVKETLVIFVSMDGNSKHQIKNLLGETRQTIEYFRILNIEKN